MAVAASSGSLPCLGTFRRAPCFPFVDPNTYKVFGSLEALTQCPELMQKVQVVFEKHVGKKELLQQVLGVRLKDPSLEVFVKREVLFPPLLVAQLAATGGDASLIQTMMNLEDPDIKECYYKYRYDALMEQIDARCELLKGLLSEPALQNPYKNRHSAHESWETAYNAVLSAAKQEISQRGREKNNISFVLSRIREIVFSLVADTGSLARAEAFLDDREIVETAVTRNGLELRNAPAFQGDEKIVRAAIAQNAGAFEFASDGLRADRDLALEVMPRNGYMLQHAAGALRKDKGVVLAAIRGNIAAFRLAADELRSDPDFVLEAMQINRSAIHMASDAVGQSWWFGVRLFWMELVNDFTSMASILRNWITTPLRWFSSQR